MQLTLGRARVGQLIHNCCLCLFILEKDCVYLDAEGLYNHIKRKTFQACSNFAAAPGASQTSAEKDTLLVARALQYTHEGAGAL